MDLMSDGNDIFDGTSLIWKKGVVELRKKGICYHIFESGTPMNYFTDYEEAKEYFERASIIYNA